MPSYQKVYYCKDCKKNVPVDEKEHCKKCGGSHLLKTWSVRFRIMCLDGEKQKRLSGYETKKEAENSYLEFQQTYQIGSELKNKDSFQFEDLLKKYFLNSKIDNAEGTLYEKINTFNRFIIPYFKGKNVSRITKGDLQEWQNILWTMINPKTKKEYAWKYKSKIRTMLRHFLSYCEEFHSIQNQFRFIRLPKNKEMKKEIVFWEIDEFNRFISSVDDLAWRTLWLTFMFTGARFNEVRAFYINDITNITRINKSLVSKKMKNSLNNEIIKPTKNYKIVIKQTPNILIDAINLYKNEYNNNTFLFGNEKPLSENTIRRRLNSDIKNYNDLNKEKPLKRITPHGFRHSYVSLLIHLGVTTKVVAELIGDTEEQVIKTYGHLYKDAKNNAISMLNQQLLSN